MIIRGVPLPVLANPDAWGRRKELPPDSVDTVSINNFQPAPAPNPQHAVEAGRKIGWRAALSGHLTQAVHHVKSLFDSQPAPAAGVAMRKSKPRRPSPPLPALGKGSRQAFLEKIPPKSRAEYEPLADWLSASNPRFSAEHWKAVELLFDRSNSRQGRAVKQEGLQQMMAVNPRLSADVLGAVASCTNSCKGWEPRQKIMGALVRIITANPNVNAGALNGVERLIGSDEGETLDMKLDYAAQMFERNPNIDFHTLNAAAGYVNFGPGGKPGVEIRLEHVAVMLDRTPDMSPEMLGSVGTFINRDVRSLNGCLLKMDLINRVMKVRPDIDTDFIDCVSDSINRSNGRVRMAKVGGLARIIESKPDIDLNTVSHLLEFVDTQSYTCQTAEDRISKMQGLETLYAAKPNVSKDELKSLMRQAHQASGPDVCLRLFEQVAGAVKQQAADTRRLHEVTRMAGWVAPRTDGGKPQIDPRLSGSDGKIDRQEKKLMIGRIAIPVREDSPEEQGPET